MNPSHTALGAVFESEWSPHPVRVVAFDTQIVMYDTWWPHKDAWAMSKLLGTFSYYRMSRTYFEAHSRYLRTAPLSEQELKIHRPDLPFAFAQRSNNSWYEPWSDFDIVASNSLPNAQPLLRSPVVFLSPFGPRNSTKPATLVHADNGSYFTEAELLRHAKTIQAPIVGKVHLTDGVGIHRLGIKKRIPSYYIWGFKSMLETSA